MIKLGVNSIWQILCWLILALASLGCYNSANSKFDSYWVYVSSNANIPRSGIGIYDWNPGTGQLKHHFQDTSVRSSSYLVVDESNFRLYSINSSGIRSFEINKRNGYLQQLNAIPLTGEGPCYISLAKNGRYVMVAYYVSGSVSTYTLDQKGRIGKEVSRIQHIGSSVNPDRQEKAHAHMVIPAPSGDLVVVTDLGMDQLFTYQISDDGYINSKPISTTKVSPGYGPRHVTFHPNDRIIYVLAELSGRVLAYNFDEQRGITDLVSDLSVLPNGFGDFNKSADIHLSADGRFLYASNRGANTLAIAKIDQPSGAIQVISHSSSGGEWPRAFEVDPSGDFLLVANKRSNTISVMLIESATGLYKKVDEIQTEPAPQCIKFLKKD